MRTTQLTLFLLALSSYCSDEVIGATFGVASARRVIFPDNLKRSKNIKCFSSQASSGLHELRGGSDRDNYYGNENDPSYQYDDRRRSGDYGYQSEDRGKNNYYSGYDDRRGSSREYNDDRYGDDRYGEQNRYDEDRYYEEDYDDRGGEPSLSLPKMPSIVKTGNKRIGMMLLGGGGIFTILGISLFFNKSLLRLGNLLFIAGVPMTIGPGRTAGYFFQPRKSRATACLALGIFLVFIGWPISGMALEIFGVLNLFGNMFPVAIAILRQMPVVGTLLGKNNGFGSKKSSRQSDRYADDDRDYDGDKYY